MEFIKSLLGNIDGALVVVLVALLAINALVTALMKGLEVIMDRTASPVDNQIHGAFGQAAKFIHKILSFAFANSTYLPPKVKAELERAQAE